VFEGIGNEDNPTDLTDLCVFGIPGAENGARFRLVKSSPRRWELKGVIPL
jgi:hypothetical protein